MQTDHEKLVDIIKAFDYYHEKSKATDNLFRIIKYLVGDDTEDFINNLATAILKEFVRKDSIEVDEEKLARIIYDLRCGHEKTLNTFEYQRCFNEAHAISTKIKELIIVRD